MDDRWLVPTGVLAVFAVLESVVGFRAGCFVFVQLMRIGVIPQEACVECASIDPRQAT